MHIHDMWFYGEIPKFFTFYHFDSDPRFPLFLLYVTGYVRWKSGVSFVRRCFRDEYQRTKLCLHNKYEEPSIIS